jgi:Gpi18-like mannosyltransferase
MTRTFPPLLATMALAVLAHWWLWPYGGTDVATFLLPWFRHIQQTGPIQAFAAPFGDYAPPYLYLLSAATLLDDWAHPLDLIKILSVAGSLALTGAVWYLLRTAGAATALVGTGQSPQRYVAGAALVLILPSTLLNAALLSQCDAMWSAACVMALAAAVARRHRTMLAWCGVALAFKLQAAFFAPFVLGLLIRRRIPMRLWPIAGLVWVASLVPASLAGWPAADLLTIYLRQTESYAGLSLNAPNLWMIVDALPLFAGVPLTGLAFAAAIGASATYVARLTVSPLGDRRLMEAAMLAPMIVVGLLPRMHERYFFLADVVALAIALTWPDRRSIGIAILVQLGSTLGLLAYVSGISGLAILGAVPMIAATFKLARPLFESPANDNPAVARASA